MKLHLNMITSLTLCLSAARQAPDTTWTPLFNGKDLSGWEHVGEGGLVVENGLLKTEGGMGLLWYTGKKLRDVVLRVEYRNPEGKNAGVFIRIPERPTEPWMPVHRGYEVQIDDGGDDYHVTGVLYSLTGAMARPAGQASGIPWRSSATAIGRSSPSTGFS